MKLLSTTQTSTVAGGIVTTTIMATVSSVFVAAGSSAVGLGGSTLLGVALPIGIVAGCVAHHEARSHGGNLGVGGIVGAFFSGTSTLVSKAWGSSTPAPAKPTASDIYCLTHDCSLK